MNIQNLLFVIGVFLIVLIYPSALLSQTTSSIQTLIEKGYIKLDKKTGIIYEDIATAINPDSATGRYSLSYNSRNLQVNSSSYR